MGRISGSVYGAISTILFGTSPAVLALITRYPAFGGQALRYMGSTLVLRAIMYARRLSHLRLSPAN
ncbi:MAG: hypothetical protein H0T78_12065 [Longispora sp.]|nr:hypothetical protein [Longispora sp. (in: high G+C Gram-positive bacteria)]